MTRYRSDAIRRYVRRLAVLMAIYLATLFVAVTPFRGNAVSGIPAYALALLPALPVIGVFWAVMRLLVEEKDEFIRMLHVRQCLFATGFCLSVVTVREFLQTFDLVQPGNGVFGVVFFWAIGLGLGAVYNRFTVGTAGCA